MDTFPVRAPNLAQIRDMKLTSDYTITIANATAPKKEAPRHAPARVSRYIPAKVRTIIWQKYEGKCARCGSKYALQMEHSKPFALGGPTSAENLILLCRNCNQHRAIEVFGREKMGQYLKT